MKKLIAVILCMSFLTTGCATMFHGTTDTLYVRSEEPNTRFFINERALGTGTSAIAVVEKKNMSTSILRAEKANCNSRTTPIATKFDSMSLLGILIDWGIISILVVDMGINGATTRAAQTDYILTPECTTPI